MIDDIPNIDARRPSYGKQDTPPLLNESKIIRKRHLTLYCHYGAGGNGKLCGGAEVILAVEETTSLNERVELTTLAGL